jgi:hypothetical protein
MTSRTGAQDYVHGYSGREATRLVDQATTLTELLLSLLFNTSRCLEELRSFVKRLGHGSEQHLACTHVFVWSVRRKAEEDRGEPH